MPAGNRLTARGRVVRLLRLLGPGVLFVAACGGPVPEDSVAMFRGGPLRDGIYPAPSVSASGAVEWMYPTEGPIRASPVVAGTLVIVGSTDGRVYAVDRTSGALRWRTELGSPVTGSAAVARDLVYVTDRANRVHALRLGSGRVEWQVDTGPDVPWPWGHEGWDYYTSSPAIAGDLVIVGSGDGNVYSLDAASGAERWRFATEGRVRASPTIADSTVLVGSADGRLYALDARSGRLRWSHDTEGAELDAAEFGFDRRTIQSTAAVSAGVAYFGSRDGAAYGVDVATGQRRWQWRFERATSWIIASPAVADGRVCLGGSDGLYVACLNAVSGEQLWAHRTAHRVFSSPAIAGSTVFVGAHTGSLMALDAASGELRWSLPLGDAILSSPVLDGDRIFVGADDGLLYAIRLSGSLPPLRAVYWDESRIRWNVFQSHEQVRDHLVEHEYAALDRAELARFMEERLQDRRPSVVVFAMDDVPPELTAYDPDGALFARYLRAGGKIVWPGLPPGFVARDSLGQFTGISYDEPARLTGVDHARFNTDRYGAFPTDAGREWGLTEPWLTGTGVAADAVSEILAHDELGGAAAWVQNYGGPPGTGFVSLGLGLLPARPGFVKRIRAVAEYSIGRVAPDG